MSVFISLGNVRLSLSFAAKKENRTEVFFNLEREDFVSTLYSLLSISSQYTPGRLKAFEHYMTLKRYQKKNKKKKQ